MSATPSKAFDRFTATHLRAQSLIKLYKRLLSVRLRREPSRFTHSDLSDLPRSALVISVAGMDSFFTARFTELLVPFIKKNGPTEGLVDLLAEAGLDTRQALTMLEMNRPYRRVRTLMDAYLGRYTTQRIDAVDRLFLSYGIRDFASHAQSSVRRKNLTKRIGIMVQRRHKIVHEGDLNDHGGLQKIDAKVVEGQLRDLALFVKACQGLSGKRLR